MSEALPDLDAVFSAALDISDDGARAAFLDQACGTSGERRRRVQKLLDAHFRAGSFLETPAPRCVGVGERPIGDGPGTVIGPYKLLEQIGEGGFGVVFMAEQSHPVRRKVALKVLKPGMDTRQVVARFEAERQALALMDHPNIAKVFDGGETAGGRPYFVMELVRGVPVTDFCDQNGLSIRERLELFVPVCHAVQHAHQKGVIHRDLKPTNILVTLHDGVPVPKVIDFGIAKATGQQLTEKTLFTNFAQMVGTPLYMSPEQAEMSGLDVDTRTDIYSLGVLLYELLTGTTPFDRERLRTVAYDEIRRIIREEEPPRPSKRLSTLGETLTAVSARRKTDPTGLGQLVRGELDWIVVKALDKDRRRRYETAGAFAADVLHFLHDEAVQACPPSVAYQFRKFARRNKVALSAAALVAAALVAGIVVSTWQAIRATRAETLAETRRQQAEEALKEAQAQRARAQANFLETQKAINDYFTLVSQSKLLNVPGLQPLRKQLLEAAVHYDQGFVKQHAHDPQLRAALAAAYRRLALIRGYTGSAPQSLAEHEKARDLWQELHASEPGNLDYAAELADSYTNIGYRRGDMRQWAEARAAYGQAIVLLEDLVGKHPGRLDLSSKLARAYHNLGFVNVETKNRPEAFRLYRLALALREEQVRQRPGQYESTLAQLYNDFGYLYLQTGDLKEALRYNQRALEMRADLARKDPSDFDAVCDWAGSYNHVGDVYRGMRDWPAAVASYERAIAMQEKQVRENPAVLRYRANLINSYDNLAEVHAAAGRPADARRFYQLAVDHQEELARTSANPRELDPELLRLYDLLAGMQKALGAIAETDATYERACRFITELGRTDPKTLRFPLALARLHHRFAWLRVGQRRWPEVVQACDRAAELLEPLLQSGDVGPSARLELGNGFEARAQAESNREHFAAAKAAFARAIELRPDYAPALNNFAWLLSECPDAGLRNITQARELALRAVKLTPQQGMHWNTLGVVHYRSGELQAAVAALDRSVELLKERDLSFNAFFLAMAHWQLGARKEARHWYDRAVAWMDKHQPNDAELRRFRAEAAALLGIDAPKRVPLVLPLFFAIQ